MLRSLQLLAALAVCTALACAPGDAPPPPVGGSCDGGTPASFKTCAPPGSQRFVDGHVVGPASAPAAGACNKPVGVASSGWNVQKLGPMSVGSAASFLVPTCTGSVSIVEQAIHASDSVQINSSTTPNAASPTSIKDPNGRTLLDSPYTSGSTQPQDALIWDGSLSPSTGALTFPDSTPLLTEVATNNQLPSGTWTFQVDDLANDCTKFSNCTGGDTSGNYDVTVITKPTAPASGTVDVAFYLVDNGGLSSTTATAQAADPATPIGRMIQTLTTIYGRAGICLGTVTFYDVPSWAQNAYATTIDADKTGPCDNLNQMFANLSQPGDTLNFFLVTQISATSNTGGTTMVVGIDGTIPGPSTVGGTIHSGAAVSIADLSSPGCLPGTVDFSGCGADRTAYITAHEGGHWLGLYHTTESTGDAFDSLTDTAQCPCPTDSSLPTCRPASAPAGTVCGSDPSKNYQVTVDDCTKSTKCGGGDDLMFWLIGSGSVGNLSAQQGSVMRANPVVQ